MKRPTKREQPPLAVRLIIAELNKVMALEDPNAPGSRIGDAVGVYAYFDYDDEPIYVGQTSSSFRDRVSRHLTGQRSDAVAKFILDPFEVAYVSMWSLAHVASAVSSETGVKAKAAEKKLLLDPYEYTVYKRLEAESRFHAVLNEGAMKPAEIMKLPTEFKERIIPEILWEDRKHSDLRIARRAAVVSRLSQMISERQVSGGMRRTLLLQSKRLTWLAEQRISELGIQVPSAADLSIGDE